MLAQARASIARMAKFADAEEAPPPFALKADGDVAINVDGDFAWEEEVAEEDDGGKKDKAKGKTSAKPRLGARIVTALGRHPKAETAEKKDEESEKAEVKAKAEPFALKDLRFQVRKGEFVAIVGRVGSGKTSLLQALAGGAHPV